MKKTVCSWLSLVASGHGGLDAKRYHEISAIGIDYGGMVTDKRLWLFAYIEGDYRTYMT